ncbi:MULTISPECIES: hypothetical protein [Herbaspirillum]|jgi:hypothetical protein|uniref:hypothetical protein n=1 Tax=Herbaspirillum TaxID=963 RepID=UPI00258B7E46|nr:MULTISPECIES: hypothetical protein [Herbaspirillum]MCP3654046.1 hypothetical protein [Herbaspirillum sp.]MCP3949120.1 hypothetical protein [Herbaspirillum sp.]MCP4034774.1 hypothetical protein [Herbaspirillum sp.]MCP4557138.1 hypothetical protein [Herbaspirillum sp.]MEE1635332.1 hypothetical protein [Herbaspirillum huttiense NC40101]
MATRVQAAAAATETKKPVAKPAAPKPAAVKKPAVKPATRAAAKPAAAAAAPAAPKAEKKVEKVAKPEKADKPVKAEKVEKVEKVEKAPKAKKVKQVRDSFTMPENEYAVLAQVKKTCLKSGVEIKKSDLLRIGVSLIKNLKINELKDILGSLTPLKVGRPKK